jgi:hypothetical protein
MLATSMQDFVTNLVDWIPTYFRHVAEIIVYMVFLSILMLTPLFLWIGAAVAATKQQQGRVAPTTPRG